MTFSTGTGKFFSNLVGEMGMEELLAKLTIGAIIYYVVAHILVWLWYWHLCSVAQRKMRLVDGLAVAILAPIYGVLPLTGLALMAAWACREHGFRRSYCYYLVATIFGRERATELYGEHHLVTKTTTTKLRDLFQK